MPRLKEQVRSCLWSGGTNAETTLLVRTNKEKRRNTEVYMWCHFIQLRLPCSWVFLSFPPFCFNYLSVSLCLHQGALQPTPLKCRSARRNSFGFVEYHWMQTCYFNNCHVQATTVVAIHFLRETLLPKRLQEMRHRRAIPLLDSPNHLCLQRTCRIFISGVDWVGL